MTEEQRSLCAANVKLAYAVLGKHAAARKLDRDDALAVAMMGLVDAARLFNPALGYRFSTYAWHSIWRKLTQAARLEGRRPDKGAGPVFACDEPVWDRPAAEWGEGFRRLSALAGPDAKVLRWRFGDGLTLQQVGETLGCTRENARQRQIRGVKRIRKALKGKGAWGG